MSQPAEPPLPTIPSNFVTIVPTFMLECKLCQGTNGQHYIRLEEAEHVKDGHVKWHLENKQALPPKDIP